MDGPEYRALALDYKYQTSTIHHEEKTVTLENGKEKEGHQQTMCDLFNLRICFCRQMPSWPWQARTEGHGQLPTHHDQHKVHQIQQVRVHYQL